tara:strand:- start:418 stop:1140 length:723 start_codon:yes stop_codon:yes gene_type:complete
MTKKGKNPRPHVLYGRMKEQELINLIKETAATYKTRQGGRIYEMKQELERRRMLTLKRKNPEEYERRKEEMLERPAKHKMFAKSTLPRGMTPMQEKFCMEYAATGDELNAYKVAGYKEDDTNGLTRRRARQLLNNKKVQARIEEYQEQALKRISWTKEKVLEKMHEVYQNSIAEGDHTNANRSLENIGKHLGMFVDVSKIEQNITTSELLTNDTDKDIERLADVVGLKIVKGGKSKDTDK